MYSKAFDGKRNRVIVQRGYSLVQLLVVMLLVSIVARRILGRLKDTSHQLSDGLVVR